MIQRNKKIFYSKGPFYGALDGSIVVLKAPFFSRTPRVFPKSYIFRYKLLNMWRSCMCKFGWMALTILFFPFVVWASPSDSDSVIKFGEHLQRNGRDVMQAFSARKSETAFSMKIISNEDLGNLLWAANGINRPESGGRTAPSALNKQDVSLYVFTLWNVYIYDPKAHAMNLVVKGDHRSLFTERMKTPVIVLLVSDVSKFDTAPGFLEDHKMMGAFDAGIVSENISIFCASMGISTRVRASMDKAGIQKLLNLNEFQIPMLNHAVGYKK